MPQLVLPYTISNGIAADGTNLQSDLTAITNWANGNLGNDNWSSASADRLALTKFATPRHVTIETITAAFTEGQTGAGDYISYYQATNFPQNVWTTVRLITVQYAGRIVRLQTWIGAMVGGGWELQFLLNGAASGVIYTPLVVNQGTLAQDVALAVADVLTFQVRRTTNNVADRIERHVFEAWFHFDHRAS